MNLLLVDDDVLVLEALRQKTDWPSFGVSAVFTAHNVEEALAMLQRIPVHLLICDIEMPGGTGLDLLTTLQALPDAPKSLVLTSYARFDYVQTALKLGATDYLLKPIGSADFAAALTRLCALAAQQAQHAKSRLYSQYWLDERRNAAEYFWHQTALGKTTGLQALPEKLGYAENQLFFPVVIELFAGHEPNLWQENMLEYALKNVLYELLTCAHFFAESVFALEPGRWLAVLKADPQFPLGASLLDEKLTELLAFSTEHFQAEMCCAYGKPVSLCAFQSQADAVRTMTASLLSRSGQVLSLEQFTPATTQYCTIAQTGLWETMLKDNARDALLAQVRSYILEEGGHQEIMTPSIALAFQQDLTQMVYIYLKEQGVYAHRLFADDESNTLFKNACRSLEDMLHYCENLLIRTFEYTTFSQSPQSIVDKMKQYLDVHFSEEISRGDLANIVYISPDYLSRIFKKETRLSLVQYITEKRMEYACHLLRQTNAPINAIAMQAGFSNFAYFSKVFRTAMECTPMEYRRKEE